LFFLGAGLMAKAAELLTFPGVLPP
jgi:hypothetical protein